MTRRYSILGGSLKSRTLHQHHIPGSRNERASQRRDDSRLRVAYRTAVNVRRRKRRPLPALAEVGPFDPTRESYPAWLIRYREAQRAKP